jgi:hypothetical protein
LGIPVVEIANSAVAGALEIETLHLDAGFDFIEDGGDTSELGLGRRLLCLT